MTARLDKAIEMLLELGNPAERRTRAQVLDQALRATLTMMEADAAAILAPWSRRGERLVLHAGSTSAASILLPPKGSEVARRMAESNLPISLGDLTDDMAIAGADGCPGIDTGPTLFTPLRQRNYGPAYVATYRRRGRAPSTIHESRRKVVFGLWLGSDLTQVYNYRFLKTALNRELRRASRYGQALSLAIVSLDNVQAHVAEHGELRGSLLLKELASVLTQQVRSFDVLGKYGDDAFMLILPQTPREGASEVAERVRSAVERNAFSSAAAGAVTVSVGVASFPQDGSTLGDLTSATERALQQAQQRGPNSVVALVRKAA